MVLETAAAGALPAPSSSRSAPLDLDLCRLQSVLETEALEEGLGGNRQEGTRPRAGGGARREVHLVAVCCCEHYEVMVLGLVDNRLFVHCALRSAKSTEEAFTLVVPLPEAKPDCCMTAMDLTEDAEYLIVASEDASLAVVPLLELTCLCTPAWSELVEAHRAPRSSRMRLLAAMREKGAAEDSVKGALTSMANAWTAMGWAGGEMLTDFLGSAAPGELSDSSALRFGVPGTRGDGDGTVTSCVWWTRSTPPSGEAPKEEEGGVAAAEGGGRAEHLVVLGSLSGRLSIVDVVRQAEVRSFSLAPIVWLTRCRSRLQEWLLIETAAEPKHWKLLLATTVEQPGQPPLRWSITDGLALPPSATEHFELEPLSGLPPLYQLLVLRGRGGERPPGGAGEGGGGAAEREAHSGQVLGMLVDGSEAAKLGDAAANAQAVEAATDEACTATPGPLCLLLSKPSAPEEPLACIDLPISASPPGAPGRRVLADIVLLLGGGVVLSIVHVSGEGPGSEQTSRLILSSAKPRPCGSEGLAEPPNSAFQEFEVPGRVVGGLAGYPSWPTSSAASPYEQSGAVAGAGADVGWSAPTSATWWTSLAVVWTPTHVYALKASVAHLRASLQRQSLAALAEAATAAPRTPRSGRSSPFGSACTSAGVEAQPPPAVAQPEPPAEQELVEPPQGPSAGELLEAALPLLCWAFGIDFDGLMLSAGEQAFSSALFESKDKAVRAACSLWTRRSAALVPLPVLMECLGQLAQDVEVVQSSGPAILQVLMPHWPHVQQELQAERPGVGAAEDPAQGRPRPKQAPLGPSVLAWFLSLVVMLLAVMHPRTTSYRGAGEYTRRRKGGAGAASSEALEFAIQWQAWVSEQVTLLLSGGGVLPSSFAAFADQVQQDFEHWWGHACRPLQEGSAVGPGEAEGKVLGPALVPLAPSRAAAEAEEAQHGSRAAVGAVAAAPAAEGTTTAVRNEELWEEEWQACAGPYRDMPECWCARLLLLAALRRQRSGSAEEGEEGHAALALRLTGEAGEGGSCCRGLVAASALVAVLLRGISLAVLHTPTASRPQQPPAAAPAACRALPARVHLGLGVVFALLEQFVNREPGLAVEAIWRMLWVVLRAVRGSVAVLKGSGGPTSGPLSLLLRGPGELLEGLIPGKAQEAAPSGAAEGGPGKWAAESRPELPWRVQRKDVRWPPPELRRKGGLFRAACEAAEERKAVEGSEEERLVLGVLGCLPWWGACAECCTRWLWRQDTGEVASLSAEEPSQPPPAGSPAAAAAAEEAQQALHALERRLLERHQVPFDVMDRLARPLTEEEAAEVLRRRLQAGVRPQAAAPQAEEVLEELPLAERAAASEDGHCDPGASAGQRLAAAEWWPLLCARCPPESMPLLALAVLALERRWAWELPWTSGFRLHLSRAAFAVRAAVAVAMRVAA